MKNKSLMRFCLFGLLMALFFPPCLARDNTTLVVFSRRTFRTGLYLIKGIKKQDAEHNRAIKFTGCKTDPGKAVDVVSSDQPVKGCVSTDNDSKGVYLQLLKASPDLPKLKATFQDFLNT